MRRMCLAVLGPGSYAHNGLMSLRTAHPRPWGAGWQMWLAAAIAVAPLAGCSNGNLHTKGGPAVSAAENVCRAWQSKFFPGRRVTKSEALTAGSVTRQLRDLGSAAEARSWALQKAAAPAYLCALDHRGSHIEPQVLPSCPPGRLPAVTSYDLSRDTYVTRGAQHRGHALDFRKAPTAGGGETPCLRSP